MIINYGKKVLDISSGCKSLFGTTEQEEMQEEVIVCSCVSSLNRHYLNFIRGQVVLVNMLNN